MPYVIWWCVVTTFIPTKTVSLQSRLIRTMYVIPWRQGLPSVSGCNGKYKVSDAEREWASPFCRRNLLSVTVQIPPADDVCQVFNSFQSPCFLCFQWKCNPSLNRSKKLLFLRFTVTKTPRGHRPGCTNSPSKIFSEIIQKGASICQNFSNLNKGCDMTAAIIHVYKQNKKCYLSF